MLCNRRILAAVAPLSARSLSNSGKGSRKRNKVYEPHPFFEPVNNESTLQEVKWWGFFNNKHIVDQMYSNAEEKMEKYNNLEHKRGRLRYNEKVALGIIRKPQTQQFINKLQERYLAGLPERKQEANREMEVQSQTQQGPDKLLGLDPFNYIAEEEREKEMLEEEYPMGNTSLTSGTVINKLQRRTPLDLIKMNMTYPPTLGPTGNFVKHHFAQSKASLGEKWKWLQNRSFDQNLSDRAFLGSTLALELQKKYLKQFELISQGRWNVLLDYVSEKQVVETLNMCRDVDDKTIEAFFTVKLLHNNQTPKILSHTEFPYMEMKFQQVLVRFDMTVECLAFDEDVTEEVSRTDRLKALILPGSPQAAAAEEDAETAGLADLRQVRMLNYVVFERRTDDFLSKYRLIGTVSEEELAKSKNTIYDPEAQKT